MGTARIVGFSDQVEDDHYEKKEAKMIAEWEKEEHVRLNNLACKRALNYKHIKVGKNLKPLTYNPFSVLG